jgi:glucuronoarabinoxylan endo-1,4-beta-xylanase
MGGTLANLFTDRDTYSPDTFAASFQFGKPIWMTEWSVAEFSKADEMTQALVMAKVIHQDFTRSHLNAFVYWWSTALLGRDGPGKNLPTKNLWALAQYSRFVRPGWRVVSADASPIKGVYVTAFTEPATHKIAIVVVNTNASSETITLTLDSGGKFAKLSVYRTSSTQDMAAIESKAVNAASTVVTLTPSSISTYFGDVIR